MKIFLIARCTGFITRKPKTIISLHIWFVCFFSEKQQYSNLCKLCNSRNGCSYESHSDGTQYSTLDCLTKYGGDVAYVSKYYTKPYFGVSNWFIEKVHNLYWFFNPLSKLFFSYIL